MFSTTEFSLGDAFVGSLIYNMFLQFTNIISFPIPIQGMLASAFALNAGQEQWVQMADVNGSDSSLFSLFNETLNERLEGDLLNGTYILSINPIAFAVYIAACALALALSLAVLVYAYRMKVVNRNGLKE